MICYPGVPDHRDTGATVTDLRDDPGSYVQLSPSKVKLQTYSGDLLAVRGEASVPVRYGGQSEDGSGGR